MSRANAILAVVLFMFLIFIAGVFCGDLWGTYKTHKQINIAKKVTPTKNMDGVELKAKSDEALVFRFKTLW